MTSQPDVQPQPTEEILARQAVAVRYAVAAASRATSPAERAERYNRAMEACGRYGEKLVLALHPDDYA